MHTPRRQRRYDHRLVELVRRTGDASHATRRGVPRSTVAGWLARPDPDVVTLPHLDDPAPELRVRIARLEGALALALSCPGHLPGHIGCGWMPLVAAFTGCWIGPHHTEPRHR